MSEPILDENGKVIHYTLKTTMTVTIRTKMRYTVTESDEPNARGTTREYQKRLHQGIAYACFNAIEHARDDDYFDETAIQHAETYIEGMDESDLTDLAEVMIDCEHGDEIWNGERIPTKEEREQQ